METVKVTIKSEEKASRLELFIRFIWGFIVAMVLGIIGIFAFIGVCVQWIYVLITGKRMAGIQKFVNGYVVACTNLNAYWYLSTDERPPFIPQF